MWWPSASAGQMEESAVHSVHVSLQPFWTCFSSVCLNVLKKYASTRYREREMNGWMDDRLTERQTDGWIIYIYIYIIYIYVCVCVCVCVERER